MDQESTKMSSFIEKPHGDRENFNQLLNEEFYSEEDIDSMIRNTRQLVKVKENEYKKA